MIKIVHLTVLAAALGAAMPAAAQPVPPWAYRGPPRFAPYWYGPRRFGPYRFRGYYGRRFDGTGYYGRGTASGGPVGGLPNRN